MIFGETEVMPKVRRFQDLKDQVHFLPSSSYLELHQTATIFKYHGEWLGGFISQFPQGFSRVHHVKSQKLIYIQFPLGGHEPYLHWEGLCSYGPCLEAHLWQRCRKRDGH